MADEANQASVLSQQLLLSVAEELKLPLLQISRLAEQAGPGGAANLLTIQSAADSALNLLDNYALGVRLAMEPVPLAVEPVSVSSVLYDVGQQLEALAKSYGVTLELSIAGRYGPVLANRGGLQAALVSLGAALIEALPAQVQESPQLRLRLATHRSRYGIVAGLYADTKQLSNEALQRGRELQSRSRQPLMNLTHTSGAGVFVADTILRAMRLNLRASRHRRLYGLGTVLQPNHQLQLV
ncbi:MAG: hypothetical protein M3N35_02980 [Candidatus Binatota bacterium]|nr:hypothetical protein [Candidatus Binatota bacterium]